MMLSVFKDDGGKEKYKDTGSTVMNTKIRTEMKEKQIRYTIIDH